ncbi:MAG TPA: cupin domain-containing protein [Candidatus Cloacimonadota bacterium]|nr:cupin domain-containing protein [Candidatus Cloacimonadota bacterium]
MNDYHNVIERLNLLPHPEGGYYRRNWQSLMLAETRDANGKLIHPSRSVGSSILYLLPSHEVCAWHRIACDEMWHYYYGSPLIMHLLNNVAGLVEIELGVDLEAKQLPQMIIPRGTWFAAETLYEDSYSYCGCTLWPSFSYADFELAEEHKLLDEFPQYSELIKRIFARQSN